MSKNRKTFSLFFFLEFFIKNKFFKEKKSVLKYQLLLRSTHVNVISNILLKTLFMNYKNKKKKKKKRNENSEEEIQFKNKFYCYCCCCCCC